MNVAAVVAAHREPWNIGKLVGQKAPLRLRQKGDVATLSTQSGLWRLAALRHLITVKTPRS